MVVESGVLRSACASNHTTRASGRRAATTGTVDSATAQRLSGDGRQPIVEDLLISLRHRFQRRHGRGELVLPIHRQRGLRASDDDRINGELLGEPLSHEVGSHHGAAVVVAGAARKMCQRYSGGTSFCDR